MLALMFYNYNFIPSSSRTIITFSHIIYLRSHDSRIANTTNSGMIECINVCYSQDVNVSSESAVCYP